MSSTAERHASPRYATPCPRRALATHGHGRHNCASRVTSRRTDGAQNMVMTNSAHIRDPGMTRYTITNNPLRGETQ